MEKKDERKFLKMVGAEDTEEILKFLSENKTAHHNDMLIFSNTNTLNRRLRELLTFGLVKHHFKRGRVREEWYEITDKGIKVLQHISDLIEIMYS